VTQAVTTLDVFFGFLLPTLAGNVVGGTILFALLNYAQVRDEIR
jgi:formate/nitrite transporter FocA (FNT family)